MTGCKTYYRIPLLTRLFKIKFYIWKWDNKIKWIGFQRDTMTFEQALARLENKRLYRESLT